MEWLWSLPLPPDWTPDIMPPLPLTWGWPRSSSSSLAAPGPGWRTDWWLGRPTNQHFRKIANPISQMSNSCITAFYSHSKVTFNTFPNYTWVTKNLHLRTAFLRLFPAIKMLTWMEPLLKLPRFTARASPRCISNCISRIRGEPEPGLKSHNVYCDEDEETPLSAYWWSCPSHFLPWLIPNEPML